MASRSADRSTGTGPISSDGKNLGRDRRRDRRISSLERDLEGDRRRYSQMLERYAGLRADLEELNRAIGRRQRLLDALRESAVGTGGRARSGPAPGTKPEIARQILWESLEPLYPRQVCDLAVNKGWLLGDDAARNQLSVAMSKMARKGRLNRADDGRYSLPEGRTIPE